MTPRSRTTFDWVITIIGVAFIAIAILSLGYDAQLSAAEMEPQFKSIGLWWYELHRGTYNGFQVLLERYVWPAWLGIWVWENVVLNVVQWPVWVLAAPIGILLFVFGRR